MTEEFTLYDPHKSVLASVPVYICAVGHRTYMFTMIVSHPGNEPDATYTFCPDCAGQAAQQAFPVTPEKPA